MGFESRGNGRYYYQKIRQGQTVRSQYLGRGELAEAIAILDEFNTQEREMKRHAWKAEKAADGELDRLVDEVGDIVRSLATAVLLVHGYHTHRRQWRKAAK